MGETRGSPHDTAPTAALLQDFRDPRTTKCVFRYPSECTAPPRQTGHCPTGVQRFARQDELQSEAHRQEFPDALLIGVHPGARIAVRRWGNDRFAEVAR